MTDRSRPPARGPPSEEFAIAERQPFDPDRLPPAVAQYIAARAAGDYDAVAGAFAGGAWVVDDGRLIEGIDAIRAWAADSSTEFAYTTECVAQSVVDNEHVIVYNHLEGSFPGGSEDLCLEFETSEGKIANLEISIDRGWL